eukprot:7389031-Prymnesium_polylepis.1
MKGNQSPLSSERTRARRRYKPSRRVVAYAPRKPGRAGTKRNCPPTATSFECPARSPTIVAPRLWEMSSAPPTTARAELTCCSLPSAPCCVRSSTVL